MSNCKHLEGVTEIDYKDYELLRKFMTDHGKIISRRLTGASAKQQRQTHRDSGSASEAARVCGIESIDRLRPALRGGTR